MNKLQRLINQCKYVVFFGGAGVSTESGIKDFKSADGLYNEENAVPPEMILSHSYFMAHTEEFYNYYKAKLLNPDVEPNMAHFKLAELEKVGKLKAVITQNIDNLHQMAGSKVVYELHGSVKRNFCMDCGKFYDDEYILKSNGVPRCDCGGIIKPDVVLYDEALSEDTLVEAVTHIQKADLLIIAGTSLTVFPASGLLRFFHGQYLALINKDETVVDKLANFVSHEKVGKVLSEIYTECEVKNAKFSSKGAEIISLKKDEEVMWQDEGRLQMPYHSPISLTLDGMDMAIEEAVFNLLELGENKVSYGIKTEEFDMKVSYIISDNGIEREIHLVNKTDKKALLTSAFCFDSKKEIKVEVTGEKEQKEDVIMYKNKAMGEKELHLIDSVKA